MAALLLMLPPAAWAQQVSGAVVAADTDAPVAGAIVSLLDEAGVARVGTLTNERGEFALSAPEAGRFRVRAERVGIETTVSPVVDLARGRTEVVRLSAALRAVSLEGITARAASRCRPGSGADTHRVWDEARKALEAVVLTEALRSVRFEIQTFDRVMDRSGRIVSHRSGAREVVADPPFRSDPSAALLERGFVQRSGSELVYHAPDAHLLLSDGFRDDYCFSIRRAANRPGMIGLAFEPMARRRHLPGVAGALWLDEQSGELEQLEYRYTRFPAGTDARLASAPQAAAFGGMLDFERLETGAWIVSGWTIRVPHFHAGSGGSSATAQGFRESGGTVRGIHRPEGSRALRDRAGALQGRVLDSDRRAPVPGAVVYLSGTQHRVSADEDGQFRFADIAQGRYLLSAYEPDVDYGGAPFPVVEVTVADGETAEAELMLPGLVSRLAATCEIRQADANGVVGGVVRERGTGLGLAGARVALRPSDGRTPPRHAVTDANGRFHFCAVVGGRSYLVGAELATRGSPESEVVVEPGTHLRRDLEIELRAPVRVTGRVVAEDSGDPVASARVRLTGTDQAALTDARGRFVIERVPPGGHRLEISHLGYGTHADTLVIDGASAAEVTVRMGVRAIAIEGVTAMAAARAPLGLEDFHRRRSLSRGGAVFLDREALDQRRAIQIEDILREASITVDPSGIVMPRGFSGFGPCGPMVYIDGIAVTKLSHDRMAVRPDEARDALRMVHPAMLEAIEIYRSASQVPSELGGTGGGCGVIALWTRRGP